MCPYDREDIEDLHDTQDSYDTHDTEDTYHQLSGAPIELYVRQVLELDQAEHARLGRGSSRKPQSRMFAFARLCKAHSAIAAKPDYEVLKQIEGILLGMDELPERQDPWKYFFPGVASSDEAQEDFMASWTATLFPPLGNLVSKALGLAKERPLEVAPARTGRYQHFINLAYRLQQILPGKDILLPTRTVAPLLGCGPRDVSRLRQFGVSDGYLVLVKEHRFRPQGGGEATRFRFVIARLEEQEEDF